MDDAPKLIDWTLAQALVAVAETGSLSAAARRLGQSQPTLGRHIKALEDRLGMELFTRAPRGLRPTAEALELLPHATAMAEAAARLSLAAQGRSGELAGTVRITASVVVSCYLLPPVLARLRRDYPGIQIELVPTDATENLIYREADIAIRMYRPDQLDVIATHICDQPTGLYAATAFLDRVGRPTTMAETMALDIVGLDKSDFAMRAIRELGMEVTRDFFPVRCDDQVAYWQLVRSGCGIGGMQCVIGDATAGVERVLPDVNLPSLPYWLAAPEALRHSPRLRLVWDELAKALKNPRL